MLKIYNIKEKMQYIDEVVTLIQLQWGIKINNEEEFKLKKILKKEKIINNLDNPYYCTLILLDNDNLIGFISLFETDGKERQDLKPWYATMYVKKEYRGNGYSKILNNAILKEAKNRNFNRVYLKTDLNNYYEKFGAVYIEDLSNKEKLYYIDVI